MVGLWQGLAVGVWHWRHRLQPSSVERLQRGPAAELTVISRAQVSIRGSLINKNCTCLWIVEENQLDKTCVTTRSWCFHAQEHLQQLTLSVHQEFLSPSAQDCKDAAKSSPDVLLIRIYESFERFRLLPVSVLLQV